MNQCLGGNENDKELDAANPDSIFNERLRAIEKQRLAFVLPILLILLGASKAWTQSSSIEWQQSSSLGLPELSFPNEETTYRLSTLEPANVEQLETQLKPVPNAGPGNQEELYPLAVAGISRRNQHGVQDYGVEQASFEEIVGSAPQVTNGDGDSETIEFLPSFGTLLPPSLNFQTSPLTTPAGHSTNPVPTLFGENYNLASLARVYYINDQRIEWSGQESTFGVEAIVAGNLAREVGTGVFTFNGEFLINQPFDRNIFIDGPERASYAANFQTDIFEVSQLSVDARWGDVAFSLGRMVTPFGRTYFPLYQNSRQDAPFIRTESILWRETGALFQYDPGNWTFAAGLMNGGSDRDTNSSKALVSRVGYDSDNFAIGGSVKYQDGIGSEDQKQFRNHYGFDIMFRNGPFQFSAEAIYDEYGLRRPGYHVNDIFWGRSIYYRDFNSGALNRPLTGFGYYLNLGIDVEPWYIMLNFGEFYPNPIGRRLHDVTTRRGIVKCVRSFASNLEAYSMLLLENNVPFAQTHRHRRGFAMLFGVQYNL